jgi:hypothetical protein
MWQIAIIAHEQRISRSGEVGHSTKAVVFHHQRGPAGEACARSATASSTSRHYCARPEDDQAGDREEKPIPGKSHGNLLA